MDRSLYTLQGLLHQVLEAINDPNPKVTMGEVIETAITPLANASNKVRLMRIARRI